MTFTERIPIFPLPFVLFPGEQLSFHVQEPRFCALIRDCAEGGGSGESAKSFGISNLSGGKTEEIGCSAIVDRILERYSDGRLDIRIQGHIRFIVKELDWSDPYPRGLVEYFEDLELKPDHSLRSKAVSLHIKLVELASGNTHTPFFEENDRASFALAHGAGLDVPQRQRFLEMRSEGERLTYLIEHYRSAIPQIEHKQALKQRVVANGHVRKF